MKITILSKSDIKGGGASRVAFDLKNLLNESGVHTEHIAATNTVNYIDIRGNNLKKLLYKISRAISRALGYPDFFSTELINIKKNLTRDNNLFHIHDISGAISPLTIKHIRNYAPVVWTFHDCSPFTGGCIQPMGCNAYLSGCNNCPSLNDWPMNTHIDNTCQIQRYKLNLLNQYVDKIICPSKWMADMATSAGVPSEKIHVIYNSTDTDFFSPSNENKKMNTRLSILLFSMDINNKYKGAIYAKEIINNLNFSVRLVVVGKHSQDFAKLISPHHEVVAHEATSEKNSIANFYKQADLLLYPSLYDNCPLTIIEALSSGLPVISYRTGGIPEILEQNVCGFLFAPKDIWGPVQTISDLNIDNKLLKKLSSNARNYAVKNFNSQNFLQSHLSIYREIS